MQLEKLTYFNVSKKSRRICSSMGCTKSKTGHAGIFLAMPGRSQLNL